MLHVIRMRLERDQQSRTFSLLGEAAPFTLAASAEVMKFVI
jgi:hypothetical protein